MNPCPFCGCQSVDTRMSDAVIAVQCSDCRAMGPPVKIDIAAEHWHSQRSEAIRRWNERAIDYPEH